MKNKSMKLNIKNKKISIPAIFMELSAIILIVLLVYVVGALIQLYGDGYRSGFSPAHNGASNNGAEFASYFVGCGLLNDKCLNTDCDQYFLCSDKKYSICEIYDCGEEFGIGTKDQSGKIDVIKKTKQEREKIKRILDRCRGSLEIFGNVCENGKLKAKVRVSTADSCEIEGFLASYKNAGNAEENRLERVEFSRISKGLYLVNFNDCAKMLELIAVGENGISIK